MKSLYYILDFNRCYSSKAVTTNIGSRHLQYRVRHSGLGSRKSVKNRPFITARLPIADMSVVGVANAIVKSSFRASNILSLQDRPLQSL